MIRREYYITRDDGVKLYRTYSDSDKMIRKNGTDELFAEAVDVENNACTYMETDVPIDDGEPTLSDTLVMLRELEVDTDD